MSEDDPIYLITEDDGTPIGMVDPTMIEREGCDLAFALAEASRDQKAVEHVMETWLDKVGNESFGYVATSALALMSKFILGPAFQVCSAMGVDLQAGLTKAAAEGREERDQ